MQLPGGPGPKGNKRDAEARRLLVRVGILVGLPMVGWFFWLDRRQVTFCLVMAVFWSGLEASLFYRTKITWGCRKLPFILRLLAAVCFNIQACWLLSTSGAEEVVIGGAGAGADAAAGSGLPANPDVGSINSISVVLPCANESEFVMKTVKAIYDATPAGELHEIIIVDDQSFPVISMEIDPGDLAAHKGKILRHDEAQGLIRSKKHGADTATGDIIIFLDCHVKPIDGWTEDFFSNIRQNPKRIVVPTITALDIDTWEEVGGSAGGRKMCLTWNADFYWCNGYPGPYVPIMSGGLLGLSRYWWETTGGYDDDMHAWGGENLDQSLRTWLCGGEIVVAEKSRVAHMWRDGSKPKTALHYQIPTEHVLRNRLRASTSWMGEWAKKVHSFQEFSQFDVEGSSWHVGSLEKVEGYQKTLQCKGFKTYLDKFQDLYSAMGSLPKSIFNLREKRSQLCLHHELTYGSQNGGKMNLRPCNRNSEAQRFHFANADSSTGTCCSGLKLHDIDICMQMGGAGSHMTSGNCFNFGESVQQYIKLTPEGLLEWGQKGGNGGNGCVAPRKEDLERQHISSADQAVAIIVEGALCTSKLEELDRAKGEFRIVAGKLCLSIGAGAINGQANGDALEYMPCENGNRRQHFVFGHDFTGGKFQLQTSMTLQEGSGLSFCIDAANGAGPVVYQCHPTDTNNPQQQFVAKAGFPLIWDVARRDESGGHDSRCVDPKSPTKTVVFTVCATNGDGTAKAGQGFLKHDKRDDGSFQLKESGTEECLTHVEEGEGKRLIGKPCQDSGDFRWTSPAGGQLKNVGSDQCVDANDKEHPILYTCYDPGDNSNQMYTLHDNGWVETPRSWADNGRVRYLSKCFDTKPVEPMNLWAAECKDAVAETSSWEKIWEETPLETQLYLDASKARGNLRSAPSLYTGGTVTR